MTGHRLRRRGSAVVGMGLLIVGAAMLLVPVEVSSFPVGIPVTCGGPLRLVTGDWMQTPPEAGADFSGPVRERWEDECRQHAVPRLVAGVPMVAGGAFVVGRRRAAD